MKCPVDNTQLLIKDRSGVEIDYCPTCRGVFLDRGELEKLIERAQQYESRSQSRDDYREDDYRGRDERQHRDSGDDDEYRHRGDDRKHHKKESFLGDFFDF